jgi:hypothetical protein
MRLTTSSHRPAIESAVRRSLLLADRHRLSRRLAGLNSQHDEQAGERADQSTEDQLHEVMLHSVRQHHRYGSGR